MQQVLYCADLLLEHVELLSKQKQDKPLKIWFENQNGKMETYQLVDEETGVNYIVVSGELYQKGIGTAITPRLKADGSLYMSK